VSTAASFEQVCRSLLCLSSPRNAQILFVPFFSSMIVEENKEKVFCRRCWRIDQIYEMDANSHMGDPVCGMARAFIYVFVPDV
jgi:hypothetical protein